MAYENNKKFEERRNSESVFSKRVKAGKRRTYFFDVKETRSSDFFITITESKKRFNDDGYDRHKMFIYKEDFNKFLNALTETVDHVKTELMPDFDFDSFSHEYTEEETRAYYAKLDAEKAAAAAASEAKGTSESISGAASDTLSDTTAPTEVSDEEASGPSIDEWKM